MNATVVSKLMITSAAEFDRKPPERFAWEACWENVEARVNDRINRLFGRIMVAIKEDATGDWSDGK